MGTSVRLPAELVDFLALSGPQSLLVRGPPGAGKTTLSLALLEAFSGKRILVTSRVSREEVHREFPWLGENGSRSIEVIQTRPLERGPRRPATAASRLSSLLTDSSTSTEELRSFLWLPEPLQEAWASMTERTPTLLVVDSWDALVEGYLGRLETSEGSTPDRSEIERILLERMAAAPVHLVLVLEREVQTQLDYLVNGVVHVTTEFSDERLERWVLLRKLRGIRIGNAMYPFTLEGGKFECIEPLRPYAELPTGRMEAEPDVMPGYIWPGSTGFAESLGRLPLGGITLVEMDPTVPQHIPYLLLAPVVGQVVQKGGPTLILPDTQATPLLLWKRLKYSVPQRKFLQHVRFLSVTNPRASHDQAIDPVVAGTIIALRPPKPDAPPEPMVEVEEFMRSGDGAGAPSLGIFHLSGLYAMASAFKIPLTPEAISSLPSSMHAFMSGKQTHSIVVGRTGDHLFEVMRPLASLHVHLRTRQGRVVLHGTTPWTPNFLLAAGQEHLPYQLLRVV